MSTIDELGKGIALGVVMLSLVLLTGYGGQISLAQLAFAGIAAATVWKLGPVVGLVGGVVIAAAVGALVALPALKMRDLYLALATMAFALFIEVNLYGDNPLFQQMLPFSLGNATADRFPGLQDDTVFFMAMAVVFALVVLLLTVIRNGPFGRRLQAMRDSPAACVTLGLDLTATKLQAFALSAGIAGLGGALLAMWKSSSVGVSDFGLLRGPLPGLPLVLVAVVSGITTVFGPIFGGFVFVMMPLIGSWYPALQQHDEPPARPGRHRPRPEPRRDRRPGRRGDRGARAGGATQPASVPEVPKVVPERVGVDGPPTAEEIAVLDDVTGLSWGRCEPETVAP